MKTCLAILAVMSLAWSALSVGGCASTGPRPVEGALAGELDGAPQWVTQGCEAYYGEPKKVICGGGSVGGTRNIAMARTGAMGRARSEIARTLKVRVKTLLKDYMSTVTGGDGFGTAADDEQYIEEVSKQITEATLTGTKLVDSWISPKSTFWALVALDPDSFKGVLGSMQGLDPKVREGVLKRADKAFEELDKASM